MDLRNTDILAWQNALVENETQATTTVAEPPVSYNPRYKDNAIVKLTFEFALSIWDLAEELQEKRKYAVSNQLFRSGTAIGALVREAQNGESLADFIHKMKISLKEGDETEYWLLLCCAREINAAADCLEKLLPIIRILNRIISTSNSKLPIRK